MSDAGNVTTDLNERLVGAATRLFAELGYDATPLELVAGTADVPLPEVRRVTGGKHALYMAVMRRAYEAEQGMLEDVTASFTPDLAGAYRAVDVVLDFYVDHPAYRALWMHRWLSDAADTENLEERYVLSQILAVQEAVGPFVPPDVDGMFLVSTIVWTTFGFLSGGRPTHDLPARHLPSPDEIERFRRYLHTLSRRMLAPGPTDGTHDSATGGK